MAITNKMFSVWRNYYKQIYKMTLRTNTGSDYNFRTIDCDIEFATNFEIVGYRDGKIIQAHTPGCEPWILATLVIERGQKCPSWTHPIPKGFLLVAWRDDRLVDFHSFELGALKPISYRADQLVQIRKDFLDWLDQDGDNL